MNITDGIFCGVTDKPLFSLLENSGKFRSPGIPGHAKPLPAVLDIGKRVSSSYGEGVVLNHYINSDDCSGFYGQHMYYVDKGNGEKFTDLVSNCKIIEFPTVSTEKLDEIRHFATGAVRGSGGKLDFPEYISGHLLYRFSLYMQKNAIKYGAGNWRKGIPKGEYWRSLVRHFNMLFLEKTEGITLEPDTDHLAAMIFNIQGLIHEEAKEKIAKEPPDEDKLYGYPYAIDESKIL